MVEKVVIKIMKSCKNLNNHFYTGDTYVRSKNSNTAFLITLTFFFDFNQKLVNFLLMFDNLAICKYTALISDPVLMTFDFLKLKV